MLDSFLKEHPKEYLATYTRNPAVIRMIGKVAHALYPLDTDVDLRTLAGRMPGAAVRNEATYHLNRYGKEGLFQGSDPADLSIATPPVPLKQRYKELKNPRHALILTAKLNGELV